MRSETLIEKIRDWCAVNEIGDGDDIEVVVEPHNFYRMKEGVVVPNKSYVCSGKSQKAFLETFHKELEKQDEYLISVDYDLNSAIQFKCCVECLVKDVFGKNWKKDFKFYNH